MSNTIEVDHEKLVRVKAALCKVIQEQREGLSFVNLIDAIGDDAHGEYAIESKPNLVLWVSVSSEFTQAFIELARDHFLEISATSRLTYLADGLTPNMPLAKQWREYATPHWVPVCVGLKKHRKLKLKGGAAA